MVSTRLQSVTSDIDAAHQAAQQRLDDIVADMSTFRTPPRTAIAGENQLLAVDDALSTFSADACVVITHVEADANYHEHGVSGQIQKHFKLPTTTLSVDTHGHIVDYHAT